VIYFILAAAFIAAMLYARHLSNQMFEAQVKRLKEYEEAGIPYTFDDEIKEQR
jgi:hypothetical protein